MFRDNVFNSLIQKNSNKGMNEGSRICRLKMKCLWDYSAASCMGEGAGSHRIAALQGELWLEGTPHRIQRNGHCS
jgi:hypothetical protein